MLTLQGSEIKNSCETLKILEVAPIRGMDCVNGWPFFLGTNGSPRLGMGGGQCTINWSKTQIYPVCIC